MDYTQQQEKQLLVEDIQPLTRTITNYELKNLINNSSATRFHQYLLDTEYRYLTTQGWNQVLKWSRVDHFKWQTNISDCDDFAFYVRGELPIQLQVNGVAVVLDFSGKHAYNAVITADTIDSEPYIGFVEPQLDKWVKQGQSISQTEVYAMEHGLIIF